MKIKSIGQDGIVDIEFNQKMLYPTTKIDEKFYNKVFRFQI